MIVYGSAARRDWPRKLDIISLGEVRRFFPAYADRHGALKALRAEYRRLRVRWARGSRAWR